MTAAEAGPPGVTLYVGDCRDVLRMLPAESVHCIVTSPPYWGLRNYGLEPMVWGGELECAHEWASATCRCCGAWRGVLGLEPTPDLYVEHIVEVFREVRRVLRRDGTLWLSLGDVYASGMRSAYADDRHGAGGSPGRSPWPRAPGRLRAPVTGWPAGAAQQTELVGDRLWGQGRR